MDARSFVDEFITAIRDEDVERYASLYATEAVMIQPLLGEPLRGRDAIREGEAGLFAAFGDIDVELVSVIADEPRIAVEVVVRALNDGRLELGDGEPLPPTGRRIEIPTAWFLELDEQDRIVKEHDYFDTAVMLRQLGIA